MSEKLFTTGDIAAAAATNHFTVNRVVAEMSGLKVKKTKGGHRRFTKAQAEKVVEEIKARRTPRYLELV